LTREGPLQKRRCRIGRNRRLAKDFEASVTSSATMIHLASIQLLTRRLARP
jgi:hypothetical protein